MENNSGLFDPRDFQKALSQFSFIGNRYTIPEISTSWQIAACITFEGNHVPLLFGIQPETRIYLNSVS